MIYVRSVRAKNYDERTLWYRNNLSAIKSTLKISVTAVIAFLVLFGFKNNSPAFSSPFAFLLLIAFPVTAAWYTYSPAIIKVKKIRQTGWIKPFVVGFIWAGWVIVYPLVLIHFNNNEAINVLPASLIFLQNFLFFSINAIIFDIKDYHIDLSLHLKTFPVIYGIKNTFRFVILPLIVLNLVVLFIFQVQQRFSLIQALIQLIPYLLLIVIIATYRRQRSVLYYLAAVDGLVFVKAICGILSILFF